MTSPLAVQLDGPAASPWPTILEQVRSPRDLRDLDPRQLRLLAAEIREIVVDSVQRHGGHLGSNLGVVELTIALHRCFESPEDVLLWDTGHQVYPHKILTGRADGFASLRQAGGLSGYSSRAESEHDHIENSHASTALAWAHGYANARRLLPDRGGARRQVVAVIGDGSLTGGMAFEGLNNLGHSCADCLVVLNDNGRSYAPTVSRLSIGADAALDGPGHAVGHTDGPADGPAGGPADGPAGDGVGAFFEALGFTYVGPVDGHDLEDLERVLAEVREWRGPRLVHVVTHKGRGFRPAERDRVKRLHDTSVMAPTSYTAAFSSTLLELAALDPRLVAVTAAMPDSTGLLAFARAHPDRFFDVGIAEQHAVTMAAGMALNGLVPVVAIYSTFLTRAFDQALYDVGLHRAPVVLCVDRAGVTGDDGASHHGAMDLVLLSKVPGLTVLAPSSNAELDAMLRWAVGPEGRATGPIAIRWPKTAPPADRLGAVGEGRRGRCVRRGADVCVLAVGKMVERAVGVADRLAGQGIEATVWDVRCAAPLDDVMLADAVRHPLVVTLEDGLLDGGVGDRVRARLDALTLETGAPRPPVEALGLPLGFLPHGKPDSILAELGLGVHQVADHVRSLVTLRTPQEAGVPR